MVGEVGRSLGEYPKDKRGVRHPFASELDPTATVDLMDDLLDLDEQALVKKSKPVGWFVAGAIAIAAGTAFAAYYFPLAGAHEKLVQEHEALAKKSAELDHSLKSERAALAQTEGGRDALQRFVDAGIATEKERKGRLQTVLATVERELAPFVKAKLVEIGTDAEGIQLSFQEKAVFRPGAGALAPNAGRTLCKAVAGLTGAKDFTLEATARGASDDAKYWETATERAKNVAELFEKTCSFSSHKLRAIADRPSADTKGTALFVQLRLDREKVFSPSDAPGVSASVAP
jgi:hypothetical protein